MIIGISGKIKSGKDTVGAIIEYLTSDHNLSIQDYLELHEDPYSQWMVKDKSRWETKKFADKLKDIVCLLINCTREDLENQEFKETELGEEWWYFKITRHNGVGRLDIVLKDYLTHQEYREKEMLDILADGEAGVELIKTTPRLLLQLIGTDCGRNIIHPNVWINATMSEYRIKGIDPYDNQVPEIDWKYPMWIVTDTRFPNEAKAVEERKGFTIRVNRKIEYSNELFCQGGKNSPDWNRIELIESKHESETALDDYSFDYVINNNGSIEELVEKVKDILIKEKVL